jgi:dGTPase
MLARRIAGHILLEGGTGCNKAIVIDPNVVEAASLIHDMGHPPFGHVAEEKLNELAMHNGCPDGFEGNAQSFHIVTQLASHRTLYSGLNLTRATLNATLKYPWFRDLHNPTSKKYIKFSAYKEDEIDFQFARKWCASDEKSMEAQIMDFADDVTYSIHDLLDFYCAGLLPLEMLLNDREEFHDFIAAWMLEKYYTPPDNVQDEEPHFRNLLQHFVVPGTYIGSFEQRAVLKTATSDLITDFILALRIEEPKAGRYELRLPPEKWVEIQFLKQLVWYYVICNPRLATLQEGHKKAIEVLFETYCDAVVHRNRNLIPGRFRMELDNLPKNAKDPRIARLAVDIVACLTDSQALSMYRRIRGIELGALSDFVSY